MKEVLDMASSLQRAVKAHLLYGHANHPRAREATESVIDHTEAMLKHDKVQIVASRGSLFVHGQLVGVHSPAIDWLIEALSERRMNGFEITKGVTASELAQLVKIFTLKPPQLENLGGAGQILSEIDSQHIRISQTRYEEVRDGEIVINASEKGSASGATGYDPSAALASVAQGQELQDDEAARLAAFMAEWIQARTGAPPSQPSESQAPGADPASANAVPSFPAELVELLQSEASGVALLQSRLKKLGISRSELDEILEVVAWENLDVEARLQRSLEGDLMFEIPIDRIVSFINELVQSTRREDAARVVEKFSSGLFSASTDHRKTAADGLQRIVGLIIDPGLPLVIEATIEKQLLTHFVKETDPQIQRRSQMAFMRLYDTWILRGQLEKALGTLRRLETVASASSANTPWKQEVFGELLDRLISEERTNQLLDLSYAFDLDRVAREVHPMFAFFGGRAAVRLLGALEIEEDRSRRGRLIKAIKAIGKPALQHLETALDSSTWYLVRNALNVLGDLTAMELIEPMGKALEHEDDRVRRAAARALGKLGGRRVEASLVEALKANSGDTQIEILAALGSLKAESAIKEVMELTKPRRFGRADDPVRLKAIETIGSIGSIKGVAPLAELVHRKGVLGGQEPAIVRKAVCLALLAIGSLDAYKEVQAVADAEADTELKAELSKALWH